MGGAFSSLVEGAAESNHTNNNRSSYREAGIYGRSQSRYTVKDGTVYYSTRHTIDCNESDNDSTSLTTMDVYRAISSPVDGSTWVFKHYGSHDSKGTARLLSGCSFVNKVPL